MTSFEHIVTKEQTGERLDKLITSITTNYSRQQVQTWVKEKAVEVNGKYEKANYKCKEADIIQWTIPITEPITISPEPIPLSIVYEDENLLVVNKPKGMLVHPTAKVHSNTLVNALKYHCKHLSTISGEERPGIVHRLDQDTSGALIVAKDNDTHLHLKEQFKNQTVTRIYEAVVFGVMQHNKGVIRAPIGRDPKTRLKMAVVPSGKYAETHFEILQRFSQHTHVQCELKTGRTHQIRVHLKYIQHPIVGDEVYCRKKSTFIKGQALFAKQLSFLHPKTEEQLTFTIERPKEFENLLQQLQNMS